MGQILVFLMNLQNAPKSGFQRFSEIKVTALETQEVTVPHGFLAGAG